MKRSVHEISAKDLPDDVLAKFRGQTWESTKEIRESRMREHDRSVKAIASGMAKRKAHSTWRDEEHKGQALFFRVEKPKLEAKYPDVRHVMGLPLFQTGKKGLAGILSGKRANDEGRRKGTWDILYPVARGRYHSLWIEAKIIPNKLTDDQEQFARDMIALGHCCFEVCAENAEELARFIAGTIEGYETHP